MSRVGKAALFWQTSGMTKPTIAIYVDPHPELPDGCSLHFKAESPQRPVSHVLFEPDQGPDGTWFVTGLDAAGHDVPAHAVQVEDSGAGTSWLLWGDARGLRLRLDGHEIAETHLLLALDQLID